MTDTMIATRSGVADRSTKCYLLDLPGELRKRIYSYAREDKPLTYISRRLEQYSDEALVSYGVDKRRPGFIGLTQVCRQLRQEYSPIYARQVELHVQHIDLEDFLDQGLPILARDRDGKPFGDLFVDCLTSLVDPEIDEDIEEDIDILPLIRYCKGNPHVRISCGKNGCPCDDCQVDWSGLKDGIEELFSIAKRPNLWEWIDDAVDEITLQFELDLCFAIQKGKGHDWMLTRTWSPTLWEQHKKQTGFPFPVGLVPFRLV